MKKLALIPLLLAVLWIMMPMSASMDEFLGVQLLMAESCDRNAEFPVGEHVRITNGRCGTLAKATYNPSLQGSYAVEGEPVARYQEFRGVVRLYPWWLCGAERYNGHIWSLWKTIMASCHIREAKSTSVNVGHSAPYPPSYRSLELLNQE